jgi:capsular polysaccharide export protein
MLGCFRKHTAMLPGLANFLGKEILYAPKKNDLKQLTGIIAWGINHQAQRPRKIAARFGLPFFTLEEGFLAFLTDPCKQDMKKYALLSLICDRTGIYYDARQASDLENLLNHIYLDSTQKAIADELMQRILQSNITKFNALSNRLPAYMQEERERVLVVDQTYNDYSVYCGLANETSFTAMLEAALDENPHAQIVVKIHPKVVEGTKFGYLTHIAKNNASLRFCADYVNPLAMIKKVDKIYTVTSQLGFEALIARKEVHCFGMPFYAGWGLTNDRVTCVRRRRKLNIQELFHGSYVQYPLYLHPERRALCSLDEIIQYLMIQQQNQLISLTEPKKSWFAKKYLHDMIRQWRMRALLKE